MNQPSDERRIKIAVQKSGRLTEHSLDLLVRCGLLYSRGRDQLICYGENMPVDVLLVRDDDIPGLVQEGVCELGFVGWEHRRHPESRRFVLNGFNKKPQLVVVFAESGSVIGAVANACVKRAPRAASASITGVRAAAHP